MERRLIDDSSGISVIKVPAFVLRALKALKVFLKAFVAASIVSQFDENCSTMSSTLTSTAVVKP
jgi:hypothetical protein